MPRRPRGPHQPLNVDQLQRDLRQARRHTRTRDDNALLNSVIVKHARVFTRGDGTAAPARCEPSPQDRAKGKSHSDGKIIFDSERAARECIRELHRVFGDKEPSYIYKCPRSSHGHVHYTRKPPVNGPR